MKNKIRIILPLMILSLMYLISSCSDPVEPGNRATVNIQSEMSFGTNIIKDLGNKNDYFQKSEVDSVKVKTVRILLSRIKFHLANETNDGINKEFKTGPFVFIGDSTGTYFNMASGQIPYGSYDKIKCEIHRFSSNEISQYQNHGSFKDFASNNRHSVIIEGVAFKDGNAYEFTYYGSPTANLSMQFDPPLYCEDNTATNICLQINPLNLFKNGNKFCDPRDNGNINDIDNLIKTAIKAVKKN